MFGRLGLTAEDLRVDRLLAEVQATGGDPLKLARLFGLSDTTAIRYCAELDPDPHPPPAESTTPQHPALRLTAGDHAWLTLEVNPQGAPDDVETDRPAAAQPKEATVDDPAFRQRLAAVMQRLAGELGAAAVVRRDGNNWQLQPARPAASPLWIGGDNAWTLTVDFGRASSRIELGYSSKADPVAELEELEAICRAVLDGHLVEWRKRGSASRWRLTLGDGSVLRGSTNWLLPALPWTQVEREQFAPYVDPQPPVDSSNGAQTGQPYRPEFAELTAIERLENLQ